MTLCRESGFDLEGVARRVAPGISGELLCSFQQALQAGGDVACVPGSLYEESLSRARRRGQGIFYTPLPLARYTVATTLEPLLRNRRSVSGALQLRVADLACGGGVFAVATLQELERHCLTHDAEGVAAMGGRHQLRWQLARNCLVAVDIDPLAASVCRLAIASYLEVSTDRADELLEVVRVADSLLDELDLGPLAAIVGNPPWGQKDFVVDELDRAKLRERFVCARGPLDPFKLFIERTHELLSDGGRWGMVLPDVLLLKDQEPVRRLILAGSEMHTLVHLERPFPGVNLDAVILVAGRTTRPSSDHRVSIWHALPSTEDERSDRELKQSVFSELPGAKFNLYLDEQKLALYRRLRRGPRLGDAFEIHEGVHSGNCRAKLFRDQEPHGPRARLVLGRGELQPFQLRWGGRWIDLKEGLVDKGQGEYANLGRAEWHRAGKLVVRRTGDRVVAARDVEGYYVSNNMFVLLPIDSDVLSDLTAYLGLLGSSLYTWFFRTEQPRVGRLFAELKIRQLKEFPLPEAGRWRELRGLLSQYATEIEDADSSARRDSLDETVAEMFQLSPDERRMVASI